MRITYFAPDLSDTAAAQRVRMLRAGGAELRLLGFRRTPEAVPAVEGVPAIDLGQTFRRRLGDRMIKVLFRSVEGWRWRAMIEGADVLLARNLEMWTIADSIRLWTGSRARLIYECLDIHGLQSRGGLTSTLVRAWEKRALKRSAALVVSSPGFLTNHFERMGVGLPPVILAENKRVMFETDDRATITPTIEGPPWRIGWFGILRCTRSFELLASLARRMLGLVDIELRGRPTDELMELISRQLPLQNMRFHGPYDPSDLAMIYRDIHFSWVIDYTDYGKNSSWLLPNRIYEGNYYNKPVLALSGTEIANWLRARHTGVLFDDPDRELGEFLSRVAADQYRPLQHSSAAIPTTDLVYTKEECVRIVHRLAGVTIP